MKKVIAFVLFFVLILCFTSISSGYDLNDFLNDAVSFMKTHSYGLDGKIYMNAIPEQQFYTKQITTINDVGEKEIKEVYCDYISFLKYRYDKAFERNDKKIMLDCAIAADEYRMYLGIERENQELIKRLSGR